MNEEKVSKYRILSIIAMFASIVISSGLLCVINKRGLNEILCVSFIIIGVIPIIVFELGFERRRELLGNNTQTSYGRVALGVFISCLIMTGASFLPEFFRPVLLLSVVMVAFSNETLGMVVALLLNTILAITSGGSFFELLAYVLMIILGAMLVKGLKETDYHVYIALLFGFLSILIPNIFYYLAHEEIALSNLGICVVNGFIIAVIIACFPKVKTDTDDEITYFYGRIISEDYVQVRAVHAYSRSEYLHARKVSDIASKYAERLGLRADLVAAAGFYYRMGRWEGEPFVENAVKKANELCFPDDLIQIISEYNGEVNLPSTPESALVHIIDGLIIKLELLEEEVGTSQWNREVLIYQTLNEFSTAGLYDKSGLSINAFLKIREWLAKEELL